MIKIGSFINGKEYLSTGDKYFDVINPATGKVIAQEACADEEWINRIVESGYDAFHSESWQGLSPAIRGNMLFRLADLVEESEDLIRLEVLDTGKPLVQVRDGEIALTAAIIRFYAGAADKIEGHVKSSSNGELYFSMYEPYGVVAGILPWNYPLVNVAMKVAPALAAGNSIIVKPSVETPLSAVLFGKLCIAAGIPAGVVNIALGSGSFTGNYLVNHPLVHKISFTGSTSIGQHIHKQAIEQMKTVNLELGGKNAILVFEDADLNKAANAAIYSAFVNTGQLCVSCSRLLVQNTIQEEFEALLLEKLNKVKVGNPEDDDTLIGPMITKSQYDMVLHYVKVAIEEGGRILVGGKLKDMPQEFNKGFWLEPTIVTNVKKDMKIAREEIFGPVLSVLSFRNEKEAVRLSNSVIYGLSGSVWTSDSARALRLTKALETGVIWVNSMLTGYPQVSVPPHKMSGTGVELGMEGLMAYCKQKSVVISYDGNAKIGWNI